MKILCAPKNYEFSSLDSSYLQCVLFDRSNTDKQGSLGGAVRETIRKYKLSPVARAWDLLSLSLSVIFADASANRDNSPDGWTRQLDMYIAVSDPDFWNSQADLITKQLRFLTTDIWNITFIDGGIQPDILVSPTTPEQDCVVLLSGGLDSLIGAINLVNENDKEPYAVSQIAKGNKDTQEFFASQINSGLKHLQLNHNVVCPSGREYSQRARSMIFFAYGVLVATTLKKYLDGHTVTLYVCENGFISINPPLTGSRLGSLSTRTTHPYFMQLFQQLLYEAGLRVTLNNPHQFETKGEMLRNCADQKFLMRYAHISTSCGKFTRNNYIHCGRCFPCLIRRAAFLAWGERDKTPYVFENLSRVDKNHSRYDDVRCSAMAIAAANEIGYSNWATPLLSSALLGDNTALYSAVVKRGLEELSVVLGDYGVT